MNNTPITDELAREFSGKRLSSREAGSVWSLCRDLERELVEVKKQRDALADALSPFVTLNPLSKRVQEKWHGYVLNAKQALAATKGGSHVTLQG